MDDKLNDARESDAGLYSATLPFLFEINSTQYNMKKVNWWLIAAYIAVIGLVVLFARPASAQNVVRKGNVFEQVVDSLKKSQDTPTDLIYRDRKGHEYQIYLSSRGNAYVNMISKNGKPYKRYLPEITRQLGTKKDEGAKK